MIGTISSVAALFAPVQPLVCCALAFVCVDFATGVAASYKRAGRMKRPWAFESDKAWRTVYKAGLRHGRHRDDVADRHLHPPVRKGCAWPTCSQDSSAAWSLWSYLENAAEISEHPLFRKLKNT